MSDEKRYAREILEGNYTYENVYWRLNGESHAEDIPVFVVSSLSKYCELTDYIRQAWSIKARDRLQGKKGYVGEILPWFRGVRTATHTLTPSLAWQWIKYHHLYESIEQLEDYYYDRFTRFGRPFLGGVIPNDKIEWNYIMRHHNIPSRLLDWTKGSLIALSYATLRSLPRADEHGSAISPISQARSNSSAETNDVSSSKAENAAVWMLEPRRLMEISTSCLFPETSGIRNIASSNRRVRSMRRDLFLVNPALDTVDAEQWKPEDGLSNLKFKSIDLDKNMGVSEEYWKYPLPLIPSHISARVGSHLSRFTLHSLKPFWENNPPDSDHGMDSFAKKALAIDKFRYLVKIELHGDHLPAMARGLRMTGAGDLNLTQDLDGLSRELRKRAELGRIDDITGGERDVPDPS